MGRLIPRVRGSQRIQAQLSWAVGLFSTSSHPPPETVDLLGHVLVLEMAGTRGKPRCTSTFQTFSHTTSTDIKASHMAKAKGQEIKLAFCEY